MADALHALDSKHKASLERFVEKNDWIQSKIRQLETSPLPAVDADESVLDEAALLELVDEHNRIEADVQELDNGELRALRLLARAASKKSLSTQDTDLIEITLKVLFSVDKLLHLLRIRGKALHLLQLKTKWLAAVQKVEDDLQSLLRETIPAFAKKARWCEPQDVINDEKRIARISNASISSAQTSPSSIRAITTSSTMARQMRAEILSLDLASLTGRIHTLSFSTLNTSSKFLDAMIDASPAPLPESFLDKQDALEARVKEGLDGVNDFCHSLARQWREVDDAFWTCREVRTACRVLISDTVQATLKLPSEASATEYEGRLASLQSAFQKISGPSLEKMPMPVLPVHIPDQGMWNLQVADALRNTVQSTEKPLEEAREAVQAYRNAAQALMAAQAYHKEVSETLAAVRAAMNALLPATIVLENGLSELGQNGIELPAAERRIDRLEGLAKDAQESLISKSQTVLGDLLTAGVDPNVRRSLQDTVLVLRREAEQALSFARVEHNRLQVLQRTRLLNDLLATSIDTTGELQKDLRDAIKHVLSAESLSDQTSALSSRLEALHGDSLTVETSLDELLPSFDTLQAVGTAEGMMRLRSSLKSQNAILRAAIRNSYILLDLLMRAQKQQQKLQEALQQASQLESDIIAFHEKIASTQLEDTDAAALDACQSHLGVRIADFNRTLSNMSFLDGTTDLADLDLRSHDVRIRQRFNQLSAAISTRFENMSEAAKKFKMAVGVNDKLKQVKSDIEAISTDFESVTAQAFAGHSAKLSELRLLQAKLLEARRTSLSVLHKESGGLRLQEQVTLDLQSLGDAIESKANTLQERLQVFVNNCEASVSYEEAAHTESHQEKEEAEGAAAERPAVESAIQAFAVECSQLKQMAEETSQDSRKIMQAIQNAINSDVPSKVGQLDLHQKSLADHRSHAAALAKQCSSLFDSVTFERFRSDQTLEEIYQIARMQAEIALQALHSDLDDFATALHEAQRRHEASAADPKRNEGVAFQQAESTTAANKLNGLDLTTEGLKGSSDSQDGPSGLPDDMEASLSQPYPEHDGFDKHLHQKHASEGTTADLPPANLQLETLADYLDVSKGSPSPAENVLHARHIEAAQDSGKLEAFENPEKESHVRENLHSAPGQNAAIDVVADDIPSHSAIVKQDIRNKGTSLDVKEDVFGPRRSTGDSLQVMEITESAVVGLSPESIRSILPAEDKATSGAALFSSEEGQEGLPTAEENVLKRTEPSGELSPQKLPNVTDECDGSQSSFNKAAAAADEAISALMDIIDRLDEDRAYTAASDIDMTAAKTAMLHLEKVFSQTQFHAQAEKRMLALQTVWQDLQQHILPHADSRVDTSRATHHASTARTSDDAPAKVPKRSASSSGAVRRIASSTISSRLPVAAPRSRKNSISSKPPDSFTPPPSRLPRPASSASHHFQTPTQASASRRLPLAKSYNVLSPMGGPRMPTPILARPLSSLANHSSVPVASPIRRERSSNRRSSAAHLVAGNVKPNAYRSRPDHKLDTAVGEIVNSMQVPVSITAAEVHRDEVGKYWIGDPPKLYYARILRSKTVMLRVGGGWQELGSFLSTHYNQLFTAENAREIARSAATSVSDPSTPKIYTQDLPGGERPWISASSLKATSSEAATRRHSFKSPRAVSLHMSPMRRSQTNSDLPFDLTSLMVKSTSHSPPATQPNAGQRNVSASAIPWRI